MTVLIACFTVGYFFHLISACTTNHTISINGESKASIIAITQNIINAAPTNENSTKNIAAIIALIASNILLILFSYNYLYLICIFRLSTRMVLRLSQWAYPYHHQ